MSVTRFMNINFDETCLCTNHIRLFFYFASESIQALETKSVTPLLYRKPSSIYFLIKQLLFNINSYFRLHVLFRTRKYSDNLYLRNLLILKTKMLLNTWPCFSKCQSHMFNCFHANLSCKN